MVERRSETADQEGKKCSQSQLMERKKKIIGRENKKMHRIATYRKEEKIRKRWLLWEKYKRKSQKED